MPPPQSLACAISRWRSAPAGTSGHPPGSPLVNGSSEAIPVHFVACSLARALKFRNQSGMALTPDQEREWIAQLEGMGVTLVRSELERGKISPHRVHLTATWLSAKDKEAEAGREASKSEQIELARRASEAADRAATAAELQAIEARRANKRATIALVIAIISIIATAIGTAVSIWLTHIDAHK